MRRKIASAVFFTVIGSISAALVLFTLVILSPRGQKLLERRFDTQNAFNNEADTAEGVSGTISNGETVKTEDGSLAAAEPAAVLKKYTVENAEERLAVCNDGTPAVYYFTPGTEENSDKWVIYLKGGGSCNSEEECLDRAENNDPGLMTSSIYPDGLKEDGILSADPEINPDFNTWNRVHVRYCSSDVWIGNTESMVGDELWQFRGKNIVQAVIEDLQNPDIIETKTLADASELLFVGSSAGGAGVTQNIDAVAAMIPDVQVRGVIDSASVIEYELLSDDLRNAYLEKDPSFQMRHFDDSCAGAQTETSANTCTFLSTNYLYIATPVYYYIDQYDTNRLSHQVTFPMSREERQWAKDYAEALIAFLPTIDGYYVPNETWHTSLTNERFNAKSIDGVSFQEALHNWYFDDGQYNYIAD